MIRSSNRKPRRKRPLQRFAKSLRTAVRHTLQHELLEARHLLAVLTVNSDADNIAEDSQLTLREAILLVNNAGDANTALGRPLTGDETAQVDTTEAFGTNDTIEFDGLLAGNTILMQLGEFAIQGDVNIHGLGADQLTIDAGGNSRVFSIDDGQDTSVSSVALVGMTIQNGSASGFGGGILSRENLSVTNSTISNNSGGGIYNHNSGEATITNSTLSGNNSANRGGGIFNSGTLTVINSTISGNYAGFSFPQDAGGVGGGGIYNSGTATIAYSTISGNSAQQGQGGGIYTFAAAGGATTVTNTIVAGNRGANSDPGDIGGALDASSAYNLIGDADTSGGLTNGDNGNVVGVDWKIVLVNDGTDPTLADNGGLTQTIALLDNSPAIDAGDPNAAAGMGAVPEFDQRQTPFTRVSDGNHNGTKRIDIGAYELQNVTISGYKWHDLNEDGVWDEGEPGLNGWTIYLDFDNDNMLGVGEPTAITMNDGTNDGAYWFTDLGTGGFTVREVPLAAGWIQSYPGAPDFEHAVMIASGQTVQGEFQTTESPNFGNYFQPGEIHGFKWEDLNGDGFWNADEPGLNDWTIYLDLDGDGMLDDDEPMSVTMSDGTNDGAYWFTDLAPGDYTVREVVPDGWTQTYPGSPDFQHIVSITSGLIVQGRFATTESPNFGNYEAGEIHGFKWDDLNGDGIWDDGEPGLIGWIIYLDLDNNGMLDGDDPTAFTMNDGTNDGAYRFTDLAPGEYTVRELVPTGWTQSYPGSPDFQHMVSITSGLIVQGRFEETESPNFGNYFQLSQIHGFKWEDLNGDGIWDAGEPGLNDWTIYLDLDGNGMLDDDEPTAITMNDGTNDGAYWFTDLTPGDYTVREVVPDGWAQSYPGSPDFQHVVTITPGLIVLGRFGETESPNFGNYEAGEIHGYKWEDLNGDGIWDAGEPGLNDWTIYLDLDGNGMLDDDEPTAVTMNDGTNDGAYWFVDLVPGDYTVREVVPDGWTQSYPGSPDFQHMVSITSGLIVQGRFEETESPNFGNYEAGEIHGYKWEDLNGDGIWDAGEPGLNDWTIYLDLDGNGMLDDDEPTAITMNDGTNDGAYWFTDLVPGDYTVREVVPDGWTQSYPGSPDFQHMVSITSGLIVQGRFEETESPNFGNYEAGEIHGFKWEDLNGDGIWDAGEPGLNDWTIYLDLDGNGMLDDDEPTAVTMNDGTNDGAYWFTDLVPGDYTVREVVPDGWTQSYPGSPDFQHMVSITSGLIVQGRFEETESPNFGNYEAGEIHGYKWEDLNGDGIWDAGEPGLNDWTIYLDLDGNGMLDDDEPTAITMNDGTNDGAYWFTDLVPGDYTVREVVPDGWTQSYPGSPDFQHMVTITSGLIVQGRFGETESPNFGNYEAGEIHGYKWEDLNGDGIWDAGEPGLNGWTIYLDLDGNGMLDDDEPTAVTMNDGTNDGAYWFTDLVPGDYTVREVVPDGWTQSYPGSPDFQHMVTITSGLIVQGRFEETESPNFGNYEAGEIHGYKWEDLNGDGIWDAGEPGLNDWTIYLDLDGNGMLDDDEPTAITMNDGTNDGAYWFTDLAPGDYTVREILPEGWTQTYPGNPDFQHMVTITSGLIVPGRFEETESPNFGNFQNITISGYKWNDLNGDGVWDAGEPGLAGWTIRLDSNGDGLTDQTRVTSDGTTDANGDGVTDAMDVGYYEFTNLGPGMYRVTEAQQADWTNTYDGSSTFFAVSGMDRGGRFQITELLNFGNHTTPVSVTGIKFEDFNRNAVRDPGEPTIAGWQIRAYADNGNGFLEQSEFDAGFVAAVLTDASGVYAMNLDPGDYVIVEILWSGWAQSAPIRPVLALNLNTGGVPLGPGGYAVTVMAGQTQSDQDFGNYQTDCSDAICCCCCCHPDPARTDFGDAPAGYGDASHTITVGGPILGNVAPDAENGSLYSANADGDNNTDTDDEEGVTGLSFVQDAEGNFVVTGTAGAVLDAWADLNGDGDFNDAGEQIAINVVLTGGMATIPATFSQTGTTYARFRVSSNAGDVTGPTGLAANGEVEDYAITVRASEAENLDFGDAPAVYGIAAHTIITGGPILGSIAPDAENAAQPTVDANGDNINNNNDEDGVIVPIFFQNIAGNFVVTGTAGAILDAWADLNGDGDFNDANEQIAANVVLTGGMANIPATFIQAGTTYARFRVSAAAGDVTGPTGLATNGEVEDYLVSVMADPSTLTKRGFLASSFMTTTGTPTNGTGTPSAAAASSVNTTLLDHVMNDDAQTFATFADATSQDALDPPTSGSFNSTRAVFSRRGFLASSFGGNSGQSLAPTLNQVPAAALAATTQRPSSVSVDALMATADDQHSANAVGLSRQSLTNQVARERVGVKAVAAAESDESHAEDETVVRFRVDRNALADSQATREDSTPPQAAPLQSAQTQSEQTVDDESIVRFRVDQYAFDQPVAVPLAESSDLELATQLSANGQPVSAAGAEVLSAPTAVRTGQLLPADNWSGLHQPSIGLTSRFGRSQALHALDDSHVDLQDRVISEIFASHGESMSPASRASRASRRA